MSSMTRGRMLSLAIAALAPACGGSVDAADSSEAADAASDAVADSAEAGGAEAGGTEPEVGPPAPEVGPPVDPGPWPPRDCTAAFATVTCNGGGVKLQAGPCNGHTFGPPADYLKVTGVTLKPRGTCGGATHCGHVRVRINGDTCNRADAPYNCILASGGSGGSFCATTETTAGTLGFRPDYSLCVPAWTLESFERKLELVADDGSSFSPPVLMTTGCSYFTGT